MPGAAAALRRRRGKRSRCLIGAAPAKAADYLGSIDFTTLKSDRLLEQILAWNPEVIVTQEPAFARRVRSDPLWSSISAVQNGRVHCAPVLPFGWLDGPPGVNRLIGLHWLLARLHPTHPAVRAQAALPLAVQGFYRLFYAAELSLAAATGLSLAAATGLLEDVR